MYSLIFMVVITDMQIDFLKNGLAKRIDTGM